MAGVGLEDGVELKESGDCVVIGIGSFSFSFPKNYSNLSVEELQSYEPKHKLLSEAVVKGSISPQSKEAIVTAHMKNLEEYAREHKKYYLDVSAAMLARGIEKAYGQRTRNWFG